MLLDVLKDFFDKSPAIAGLVNKIAIAILPAYQNTKFFLIKNKIYDPKYLGQAQQDKWVLEVSNFKKDGYFVDLGAYDGFSYNSTYILEKKFGWNGICIEANAKNYKKMVHKYKRNCICVNGCIDYAEHDVQFINSGPISGIVGKDTDNNYEVRKSRLESSKPTSVRTSTLEKVLEEKGAPDIIDYLNVDIEGAEARVLSSFPFNKYKFLTITIERPSEDLHRILTDNGYVFVKRSFYDSFYVHKTIKNYDEIKKSKYVSQKIKKQF
jgi:FkbM family methyltransferase